MIGYARLNHDVWLILPEEPMTRQFEVGTLVEVYDGTNPGYKRGNRFRVVVIEDPRYQCLIYGAQNLAMLTPLEALAILGTSDPLEARGAPAA